MLGEKALEMEKRLRFIKEKRKHSSLSEMREFQKNRAITLPPDAKKEVFNVADVEVEKITLPNSKEESALIYIHGGGFRNGFASNGYWLCMEIAKVTGQTIYGINYRLAPEYTYPVAFMDSLSVWRSLMRNGVKPELSTFIGTSAGATIALSVSLYARDHGIPLPSSIVLSSPYVGRGIIPTEHEIENDAILDWNGEEDNPYFSTADYDDPYAYPILGDYFLFPKIKLFASEKEILKGHSDKLAEVFERDKVDYSYSVDKDLWHAFLNADVPENMKYVEETIGFIISSFSENKEK